MIADRRVVPFRHWHLDWLREVDAPADGSDVSQFPDTSVLESSCSWTGVVDGEPIGCAGIACQWEGRYVAWAYLGKRSGRHMRWITARAADYLQHPKGRIEMTVREDFPAGHRWAKMLGFEVETPLLRAYGPFGENHVGYVRMNGAN